MLCSEVSALCRSHGETLTRSVHASSFTLACLSAPLPPVLTFHSSLAVFPTSPPPLYPPVSPLQLQKKKVWEALQPLLATTDDCVASLFGRPLRSPAGVVTCQSLKQANVG